MPGRVWVSGDDRPHDLEVWVSPVNVSMRDWLLQGTVWYGAGVEALRAQLVEWGRWQPKVENAILEGMQSLPALDNAPASVRAIAERYETARRYANQQGDIWERLVIEVESAVRNSSLPSAALESKVIQAAKQRDVYFEAEQFFEVVAQELLDAADRAQLWGERLAQSVGLSLERFGFAARTMSRFTKIALWTAPALSVVQMFSSHQVLIRDKPSNPLTAIPPCRQYVRGTEDPVHENTVSCPAPDAIFTLDPLNLFGLLGYTSLSVSTGAGADTISLFLTEEGENPFDEVFVDAGPNDDTILGSEVADELSGGTGNDTIYGRGGNDYIYGYDGSAQALGGVLDNDRLFGQGGSDVIQGEWGHDMIFGGKGDDRKLLFAALSGGQGNDVIVGGPGVDKMAGGSGRDTLFAKESDFGDIDLVDSLVDCGPGDATGEQYVTFSPDEGSNVYNCVRPPPRPVSADDLLNRRTKPNAAGRWPWFD